MTQSAEVRRKNNGKQFTVVDDSRFIFHWHRKGEHLPKLLAHHSGARFLLTQAHVDEALKKQRSKLIKIDVNTLTKKQKQGLVTLPILTNGKGTRYVELPKAVSAWATAKAWGLYAAVAGAAGYAAYEITKVLA